MSLDVCAHITGTVWKIEKNPGESVQEGDVLLIIESMKMEMPLKAPQAGILDTLSCKEGEAVEEGQILATIR
ncbi:MAG: acetyl-CoA carboxylase biotin carboxyl carrier protein subunit [Myxococcales bacterium]|nr:acetyl-CoA carboxylase biotin carboxyl carrier protein subunit [Myxococcales bacterium]MCB9708098.1 acetyl-CoA carboxylase biotin carboxyl carrier protein subunit [Myxococcales bacterium]